MSVDRGTVHFKWLPENAVFSLENTAQSVKKVEVQEALPPAGVIGAEPLTLVPQHFPRKPAQRCLRAITANSGFFDRLRRIFSRKHGVQSVKKGRESRPFLI